MGAAPRQPRRGHLRGGGGLPLTRLLYVCTGNICRSPFAEAAARAYAAGAGLPVDVRSASTLGLDGRAADSKMSRVAAEIGVDLTAHVSRPLDGDALTWADRVLVMELHHAESARQVAGAAGLPEPHVELLGPYAGTQEIADPHGSWLLRPYRQARDTLHRAVIAHLEQLAAELGL